MASAGGTVGQVVITVRGSNDAAVIGRSHHGFGDGGAPAASTAGGTLTVSDRTRGRTPSRRRRESRGYTGRSRSVRTGRGATRWTMRTRAHRRAGSGRDGHGACSAVASCWTGRRGEVVVTVTGSNDAATIGGDATGAVTEDDPAASTAGGTLTVSDPDAGAEQASSVAGTGVRPSVDIRDVHAHVRTERGATRWTMRTRTPTRWVCG